MVWRHIVTQPLVPLGVLVGRTFVALITGRQGYWIIENRVN
jgi:hypothetical protein